MTSQKTHITDEERPNAQQCHNGRYYRRNENSENRIAARTGQQYCGRLVNLFKVILRANLAPKMEESQLTLLQIKILRFVLWHFDLDFSVFNSQFNFSPYRFIDRYILIDSFKTDS